MKHSGCGKIEVSLKSLNKMIKCEIRDNGWASVIKGHRVKGIEERCEEAGESDYRRFKRILNHNAVPGKGG